MIIEQQTGRSLERQVAELERTLDVVHQVARAVLASRDLTTLCRTVFQSLRAVLDVDAGFIAQYEQPTSTMWMLFEVDEDFENTQRAIWNYRRGPQHIWVIEQRQPLVFADLHPDLAARFPSARLRSFGKEQKRSRAWMSVPILLADRLVGLINLQSYRPGIYGAEEVSLLQTLTRPLAVALENARLIRSLEQSVADLEIPIIPLEEQIIVVPLVDMLDAQGWDQLVEAVLQALARQGGGGVLLDASGVSSFDTQAAQALSRLAGSTRLMGGQLVMIGARPQLTHALVLADVQLQGIETARDLAAGSELLRRQARRQTPQH